MNRLSLAAFTALFCLFLFPSVVVAADLEKSSESNDSENYRASVIDNATRITTAPRMKGADAETGEGMLEAFGTRYMPNAYANYQKTRETAKEREQLLHENFPNGRDSDSTGGGLYDKVAKSCAKAVAEMLRRHDELCHFYVLHKAGGITDADLSKVDSAPVSIRLPEEALYIPDGAGRAATPSQEELTFAEKYLPEIHKAYQTLRNDLDTAERNYNEIRKDAVAMDSARTSDVLGILNQQLDEIRGNIYALAEQMKQERLLHAVGDRTSGELADIDAAAGKRVREFRKTLPYATYSASPYVLCRTDPLGNLGGYMATIPGKSFRMARYEVTQGLWEAVMGNNPAQFKGADLPVECVLWYDCQEFLKELNSRPEVIQSGLVFRLPTEEEWEYACRAGSKGDYCRLADGTEITKETLGTVAWFGGNSDRTHPVGQKKPNAWGLYDMHGNVCEWTQTEGGLGHLTPGGGWRNAARNCGSSYRGRNSRDFRNDGIGFRLCASVRAE